MPRKKKKQGTRLDLDAEIDQLTGVSVKKSGGDSLEQMTRRLAEIKEAKEVAWRLRSRSRDTDAVRPVSSKVTRSASAPADMPETSVDTQYLAPAVPDIKWIKRRFKELTDIQSHYLIRKFF